MFPLSPLSPFTPWTPLDPRSPFSPVAPLSPFWTSLPRQNWVIRYPLPMILFKNTMVANGTDTEYTRANYIVRNIICINCHPRHRLFVDSHHTWSIMDTFICRHHWTRHCDDLDNKVSIATNTLWEFVPRPLRSNWISYTLSISHKTQIIFSAFISHPFLK